MHKFAKILPESECGSRLRMVRWYYQTRFENGLMQKKADCGSRKSGSSQERAVREHHGETGQVDRLAGGRTSGPKEEMGFHQG